MKKEYIETIFNKLTGLGIKDYGGSELTMTKGEMVNGVGTIGQLRWLPEENLKAMSEYNYKEFNDIKGIWQFWGQQGWLKFTPYMIEEDDNPSLVLKTDRFLHMFRGYHYQVSGSKNGDGDYGSGLWRTDWMLHNFHCSNVQYSKLFNLIYMAAAIDVGMKYDVFQEYYEEHKEELFDFLKCSAAFWRVDLRYDLSLIDEYLDVREGSIVYDNRRVFENDNRTCRFAYGTKSIQVEVMSALKNKVFLYTLRIPEFSDGLERFKDSKYYEEDVDDIEEFIVNGWHKNQYIFQLLTFVLKLAGIEANFTGIYSIRKQLGKLPVCGKNGIKVVGSLNNFYDIEPEEETAYPEFGAYLKEGE